MFDFSKLFGSSQSTASGIPALYNFGTSLETFIQSDITNSYKRILIDVVEKSSGMPADADHIWWDSYVQSDSGSGLLTLLSEAMYKKTELFIVYSKTTKVIRVATNEEQTKIREEYKKSASSKMGVYVSFKNYTRTDMLKIYSTLEYCLLCSLNKILNLAKAVQLKISGLRGNVSLSDSSIATEQGKKIADALARGDEIMIDKEDEVTTATVDTAPTEKGISFLEKKKSFILGLPTSYVSGEQTPGIGSTGEADMRAVEKGLKQYFHSIIKPVIRDLLGVELHFRSDDFRYIGTSLELVKTFDLISSELLSSSTKREIIAKTFNIDAKEEEKKIKKEGNGGAE